MQIYVVQQGDHVDEIAKRFQVAVETIIYENQLAYPYPLAIGQALLIDDGGVQDSKSQIVSGGFAYPYIDQNVLNQTLPFLTELSAFSYGFTTKGTLIPPSVDDTSIVNSAMSQGVRPILTLTSIGEDGNFDNIRVHILLNDQMMQQQLIIQLSGVMLQKGYRGLDIDFEYLLAEDRESFVAFVAKVTKVMNEFGYQVSVDLPPKTSDNQKGLLYEGIDYKGLAQAANHVLLMTYEWGYSRGPAMAVAPLNKVRQVVEYALTQMAPEKIMLGIPNYGYDWALPFEQGVSIASSIGTIEAVQRAIDFGVPIQFDPIAKSPYYRYWQSGVEHEVWFEDVRSIYAKFQLIHEFGLRGAGYWQLMRLFRANWSLMEFLFYIYKE